MGQQPMNQSPGMMRQMREASSALAQFVESSDKEMRGALKLTLEERQSAETIQSTDVATQRDKALYEALAGIWQQSMEIAQGIVALHQAGMTWEAIALCGKLNELSIDAAILLHTKADPDAAIDYLKLTSGAEWRPQIDGQLVTGTGREQYAWNPDSDESSPFTDWGPNYRRYVMARHSTPPITRAKAKELLLGERNADFDATLAVFAGVSAAGILGTLNLRLMEKMSYDAKRRERYDAQKRGVFQSYCGAFPEVRSGRIEEKLPRWDTNVGRASPLTTDAPRVVVPLLRPPAEPPSPGSPLPRIAKGRVRSGGKAKKKKGSSTRGTGKHPYRK